MKNDILVSICCLAYNHKSFIAKTIESFLMQKTNFRFEILLHDDASTDGTREIIKSYSAKYPNLIFPIFQAENQYSKGRKPLIDFVFPKAKGKYIAWCDGDDFWTDPLKLQKQVDILEMLPEISICFHNVQIINEQTGAPARLSNVNQKQISTIYDLAKENFIYSASCVFRNNLFEKYPEFIYKVPAGDYVIHILNASKGDIYYINEVMACYRIHSAGMWENKTQKERNIKWLTIQDSLIGLFNEQIDTILYQGKASLCRQLAKQAHNESRPAEEKEHLLNGIDTLMLALNNEQTMTLMNLMLAELRPLVDRNRDDRVLNILGIIALRKGMFSDAVLFFNDVLKINPNKIEVYLSLAEAYDRLEDNDSAINSISKYLAANPNDADAIVMLCDFLVKKDGMEDKVITILERLLGKIDLKDFKLHKNLGIAYHKAKQFDKALKHLMIAESITNFDAETLIIISKIKSELGTYSTEHVPNVQVSSEMTMSDNPYSLQEIPEPQQPIDRLPKAVSKVIRSSDKQITVSIVIPVFNKLDLTRDCIDSIYGIGSKYKFEIIVVDNASSDGTLEYLKLQAAVRENFRFMRNHSNLGFAKACNIGFRSADGDYILLLNNDIIVMENWLDAMVESAESDEDIAIVGSLLFYPDGKTIQHCGVRVGDYNGQLTPFHIHKLRDIQFVPEAYESAELNVVTGASMLIRKDSLATIGVLDEQYINSYEDVDFCLRAREAGYKVFYCGDSRMLHYESVSAHRHDNDDRNWEIFNQKWLGKFQPDITDDYIDLQHEVWYREELVKSPDSTEYLNKLSKQLKLRNQIEESSIFEERLRKQLNKNENILPYSVIVSFIILVRDNLEYTKNCIDSILNTCNNLNYEIIIVDNDSSQPTKDYLFNLASNHKNIRIIFNKENKTYAVANNQGASAAEGKYLIFLNNDTKLLENSVSNLIETFEDDMSIGVQGAKLLYPNNSIQHAGIVWGPVSDKLELHYHIYLTMPANSDCVNISREYQFVTGAMLAIRNDLFVRIGGFDENYIFGHEDLDLCMKTRQVGKKVWFNHEAAAYHYESVTKKTEGIEKFERFITHPDSFDARNHKYFLSKWEDVLLRDADSYFISDGMLAFVSDLTVRNAFVARLNNISKELINLQKSGDIEGLQRLMQVLFGSEMLTMKNANFNLSLISEEKLEIAEIMLGGEQEESFDIYDLFDEKPQTAEPTIFDVLNTHESSESIGREEQIAESPKVLATAKSPRILMTMYGWNESGGGTTFPKSVAKRLAARGIEVAVLYATHAHGETNQPYYLEEKIEDGVHLYGVYNRPTVFLDADNPEREIKDDRILEHFEKILREFKPDIVHFNNFLGLSFAMAEFAKSRGFLTIYTPYNYHLIDPTLYLYRSDLSLWSNTDFFENSELLKRNPDKLHGYEKRATAARNLLNEHIDYTFAVSSRVRELLIDFGAKPEKITVIHQVHETIEQLLKNNPIKRMPQLPLKFGFIGGVMPHKGAHIIVQAAQLIPKNSAEFYIHGFVSDNYAQLLKSLDRNNSVRLMGEYQSKDFPEIASNLDAMILPSLWEDCAPFVITESLAMKLPVICARIGGFPDFIKENVNGRLYTYNSSTELATILHDLVQHPERISRWQEKCKITFSFDQHIDHLIKVYQRLSAGERPEINDIELIF